MSQESDVFTAQPGVLLTDDYKGELRVADGRDRGDGREGRRRDHLPRQGPCKGGEGVEP